MISWRQQWPQAGERGKQGRYITYTRAALRFESSISECICWGIGRETHAEAIDGEATGVAAGGGTRFPSPPVSPPHPISSGRSETAGPGGRRREATSNSTARKRWEWPETGALVWSSAAMATLSPAIPGRLRRRSARQSQSGRGLNENLLSFFSFSG